MIFEDQLQRKLSISNPPQRIISLVPSQTELLVDLGLEERIVGVTKFCVRPKGLRKSKAIVGGTKNYRMEDIASLQPDLIIGNKEENEKEGIAELMEKYPVWMSDILTIEDSYKMIQSLGEILDVRFEADKILGDIKKELAKPLPIKGKAFYLIWNEPIMGVGRRTFIDQMLSFAGFENLIQKERYPEISLENLVRQNPDYLLLSSEPFPFKQKHVEFFKDILPDSKVLIVDGEYFSWYGSRLLGAKSYFETLI
ncbi:helical backbone metal receptor [Algoriphagus sp.]|uniref:helical backbone metal receptor n=1 Tax=Algoriphagus sp. TaxID=1872435 RepID=UPI0025FBC4DE|nr:helical backbone metal receptor [Algoriphagus sp.]